MFSIDTNHDGQSGKGGERENEIVFHERRAFENKTQKRQRMSKD